MEKGIMQGMCFTGGYLKIHMKTWRVVGNFFF